MLSTSTLHRHDATGTWAETAAATAGSARPEQDDAEKEKEEEKDDDDKNPAVYVTDSPINESALRPFTGYGPGGSSLLSPDAAWTQDLFYNNGESLDGGLFAADDDEAHA